jgi:hypothetical protein
MDRAWLNDIVKRERINPADYLKKFGPLTKGSEPKLQGLRGRKLKRTREIFEACLFCYGLSCRMGSAVWVVDHEVYDFVTVRTKNGDHYFSRTQLKEVVPKRLNPEASVQSEIDKVIAKYPVSTGLTVAIRVNQHFMLDLDKITIPQCSIAALWIYAAASQDGSRWYMAGNLTEGEPYAIWYFDYPA